MNAVIALIVSHGVRTLIIRYVLTISPLVTHNCSSRFSGELKIFTEYLVFFVKFFKFLFVRFHCVILYL